MWEVVRWGRGVGIHCEVGLLLEDLLVEIKSLEFRGESQPRLKGVQLNGRYAVRLGTLCSKDKRIPIYICERKTYLPEILDLFRIGQRPTSPDNPLAYGIWRADT